MPRERVPDHLRRERLVQYVTRAERAAVQNYLRQIRGTSQWKQAQMVMCHDGGIHVLTEADILPGGLPQPTEERFDHADTDPGVAYELGRHDERLAQQYSQKRERHP